MDEIKRLLDVVKRKHHLACFSKKLHGKTQAQRRAEADAAEQALLTKIEELQRCVTHGA